MVNERSDFEIKADSLDSPLEVAFNLPFVSWDITVGPKAYARFAFTGKEVPVTACPIGLACVGLEKGNLEELACRGGAVLVASKR